MDPLPKPQMAPFGGHADSNDIIDLSDSDIEEDRNTNDNLSAIAAHTDTNTYTAISLEASPAALNLPVLEEGSYHEDNLAPSEVDADELEILAEQPVKAQVTVDELNSEDEIDNLEDPEAPVFPTEAPGVVVGLHTELNNEEDEGYESDNRADHENFVEDDFFGDSGVESENGGVRHGGNAPNGDNDETSFNSGPDPKNDVHDTQERSASHTLAHAELIDPSEKDIDIYEIRFPILLQIAGDEYLLVSFYKETALDLGDIIAIFDDDQNTLKLSVEGFFNMLRHNEDLMNLYNFDVERELVLHLAELGDICITEDNMYSSEISIGDFVRSFQNLEDNCEEKDAVPAKLTFKVTTQKRFITQFNSLSETIRTGNGFSAIQPIFVKGDAEESPSLKRGLEGVDDSHISKKTRLPQQD